MESSSLVIGIYGDPGSGKKTLAECMKESFENNGISGRVSCLRLMAQDTREMAIHPRSVVFLPNITTLAEATYITQMVVGVMIQVCRPELLAGLRLEAELDAYTPFGVVLNAGTIGDLQNDIWQLCAVLTDWKWGKQNVSGDTTL